MKRSLAAAFFAAGALLAPTGADAKTPLEGVDVCGLSACVHLTMQQVEGEWALFSGLDQSAAGSPLSSAARAARTAAASSSLR